MFERKGIISIKVENISEEKLMELMENIDIDDIVFEDSFYEIIVKPEDFEEVNKIFNDEDINFDGEVSLVPQNTVELSDEEAGKVVKLLELLDEHDDVQKVHSNFEIV